MLSEHTYWTSILKKIFYLVLIIVSIILALKLAVFYMPFLIAFTISLMMEPAIKKIMRKLKTTRRFSSIIVFILVFGTILGLLIWGIVTVVSEASNLLSNFNGYYEKIYNQIQRLISNFNFEKINISEQMTQIFQDTTISMLQKLSVYLQGLLSNLIKFFTSIPTIAIYFGVTIISLYFICTDKIYMIDELEHHLPEKWVKEIAKHLKQITQTLGGYLKAQLTLILISFLISLIGLYIMHFARIKCWFSTINSTWHRVCRCFAYTRVWDCNDTLGNYFWLKWRVDTRYINYCFTYYNECNKTIYRTKNSEW